MANENLSLLTDEEIERSILYLILKSGDAEKTVGDLKLSPEYFLSRGGRMVFDKMVETFSQGRKLDYTVMKAELGEQDREMFDHVFRTFEFSPEADIIQEYRDLLVKNFERNEMLNLVKKAERALKNKNDDEVRGIQGEILEFKMSRLASANPELGMASNDFLFSQMTDYLDGKIKTDSIILKTGYKTIDNSIGGFERGNYIAFAARPSVGKSVVLINMMESMLGQGYKCAFFSGELYAKYVLRRIISRNLKINGDKLKNPSRLTNKEREKVDGFLKEMSTSKSRHIYYSPKMCAREIREECVKIKNLYGLDAVFIDYLGKLFPNNMDMGRSRNDIVGDISRELFELAGSLNIVVVTATQLNREGVKSNTAGVYIPKLTDIRDSGNIEQDLDICIGLGRDVEQGKMCQTEDDKTDFTLAILKNRNGKLADLTFDFFPVTGRLDDKLAGSADAYFPTDEGRKKLIEGTVGNAEELKDITGSIF